MCTLCLSGSNNPFGIRDTSRDNLESKKARAKHIKELILTYEKGPQCAVGQETLESLREEQYRLAREI